MAPRPLYEEAGVFVVCAASPSRAKPFPRLEQRSKNRRAVGAAGQDDAVALADHRRTRRRGVHIAVASVDLDDEEDVE